MTPALISIGLLAIGVVGALAFVRLVEGPRKTRPRRVGPCRKYLIQNRRIP